MPKQETAADWPIDLIWGLRIPMRDGVHLNGTVYKPRPQPEPLPVIFTLTPYVADTYHERGNYFARHGYVFVLVDCRGRGNSEGDFHPFLQEARDGHDVVEWLAAQEWCNGKVAMWGGSYAGYNQWAVAKEFPPHLVTIVPAAAAYAGVDFPFLNNVWYPYEMQWGTLTSGVTDNANLFGELDFWTQKYLELYLDHGTPFKDLDRIVGNPTTHFRTWLEHPHMDAYWESMEPTPDEFARLSLPILTITGHYDDNQPGAMAHYRQHMQHASAAAREKHYLIVGPWDHAGTRTPNREVAGLTFGETSMLDLNDLHRQWYDWTMKDGEKPAFLKKRVAYYVTAVDKWRYAGSLEDIADETRCFYLDSVGGEANEVFRSGRLVDEPPADSTPDSYVYDPLDDRHAAFEREQIVNYLTDQRHALHLFGAGLVYHSAPFDAAIEISGCPSLVLWLSMDVPDTDILVALYEILPDGASVRLSEALIRARFRESAREPTPVPPGEIIQYTFDTFTFFSRQVAKGSRLRLVIRAPNTIGLQKNYNSGGVVAEETRADAHTAHVTLYHDAQHPSSLALPLVTHESDEAE
jgi:putative CocE/NonD family hydrolase